MLRRTLLFIATAALSMAFLAACGDAVDDEVAPVDSADDGLGLADDPTPEGEDPDQGAARTDDGDAAGQTGGSPADDEADLISDHIEVTLVDHEIQMESDTADSGIVGFIISNEGDADHGIALIPSETNGNDDEDVVGMMLVEPGEEAQLELELEAGEYIVFCPVGDHRDEHGMETTLTVEEVEDDGNGEEEEEADGETDEENGEDEETEDDQ